jgi:UDP:flavonoid glycosyltransferase YjiC (YdhE family)
MKLRKKRILFVGESFSLAHIARPLYLAESLDPNEYDIHFACDKRYQSFIEDNPFHFWSLTSIPSDEFLESQKKGGFVPKARDIISNIEQELALVHEVQPSIIINDLRFSMTISAEISKTLHATLANAHWSPYRKLGFDPYSYSLNRQDEKLPETNDHKASSATEIFNNVREKYSLTSLNDYCDLATKGDFTLYTEPQGFIPTRDLPNNHIFIGPILWEPKITNPPWWKSWNEENQIIYITLGSTGASEFLNQIIKNLQDLHVTIIAATAGRSNFTNFAQNVFLAEYLPGIVTSNFASLVICNGGSATAYQALSQGTPVFGIWNNIDQYLTIKNIEQLGAGIGIRAIDFNIEKLKQLVEEILINNSFQENSLVIKELFDNSNSKELFNGFLRDVLD